MSFVAKGMSEMTQDARFVGILWGFIGSAKTPLAATAPGRVTFLMFDFDGWKSIAHVPHCDVIDLSRENNDVVAKFEKLSDVEQNLKAFWTDPNQKTLVLDSATSFMDKALIHGIKVVGPSGNDRPTAIAPGRRGYGARGMYVRHVVMNLHTLCARYNKHFIVIAHEKDKVTVNDKGQEVVSTIEMMLGGEAFTQVPKNFSEIWHLENRENVIHVQVRPFNKVQMCRTRMWKTEGGGYKAYQWRFNTYSWEGEGIETWMKRWSEAGCQAIPLPK